MKRIAWLLIAASAGFSQTPSIDDIMGRVAANQAKSVEARKKFVYRQQELVAMHQSNGKMTCEQRREYTVIPYGRRHRAPTVEPTGREWRRASLQCRSQRQL